MTAPRPSHWRNATAGARGRCGAHGRDIAVQGDSCSAPVDGAALNRTVCRPQPASARGHAATKAPTCFRRRRRDAPAGACPRPARPAVCVCRPCDGANEGHACSSATLARCRRPDLSARGGEVREPRAPRLVLLLSLPPPRAAGAASRVDPGAVRSTTSSAAASPPRSPCYSACRGVDLDQRPPAASCVELRRAIMSSCREPLPLPASLLYQIAQQSVRVWATRPRAVRHPASCCRAANGSNARRG